MRVQAGNSHARRTVSGAITAFLLAFGILASMPWQASADGLREVRVGVLKFGTVNWELDVIRRHGLDRQNGVDLVIVPLTGKQASAVAIQGGAVDVIVTDYIWVSRQRAENADYTIVPHSLAVGGLMVRADANISSLEDLVGKRLGVAGGPVYKSGSFCRRMPEKSSISILPTVLNCNLAPRRC